MHLALYRKYRPKSFDDVISQPHITTTLKNQILTDKVSHAYLFTGSRGTGKTTCAKILSMAVNCLHPIDGSPCMECEICREIDSGASSDVLEMDAASNNGVNDIRDLRDEVSYIPANCKYRVYIIDEVHMLSTAAFNALLKTIEEPPEHVIFILATTELHKVPATIVSRCQRFEFRRINVADSCARLESIADNEGFEITPEAAELISRISDGGMRDALSVLDRCAVSSKKITTELVREAAGVPDSTSLFRFAEMIAAKDISGCIQLLNELHNRSKDIARLIDELSAHYRDLMLYKTVPNDRHLLGALPDEYPEVERIAELYSLDEILRCLTLLQQCEDAMGKTRQRKTLAEMCFVKMCIGAGVQPETAAAPAKPAPKPAPVQEVFVPQPDSELSPQVKASLNKAHELIQRRIGQTEKPAEPAAEKPAESPSVVSDENLEESSGEKPAEAVEEKTAETPTENKSEEPVAAPVPTELPEEPPLPPEPYEEPIISENTAIETPAEESNEQLIPTADKLESISMEQWQKIRAALPRMYGYMTENVNPVVNSDGVLELHADSDSLEVQVTRKGFGDLEQAAQSVLGRKVAIKVITEKVEREQNEESPVKALLARAEQLNIPVQYK